jgi:TPR repeat protein
MYVNGEGVPKDYTEAVKWFRKAAKQGDSRAQFSLGLRCANGEGVPQDYLEAVKWYRRAAEQGDSSAQNNLGLMYANGKGVHKDYVLAHMWYNLAASLADPTETEIMEKAKINRDKIASIMTPAQISKAQKLAREWKSKKK